MTTLRRPDASMTLITEVYERPLDPGYADRAAQRRAGRHMGPRRTLRLGSLITAMLVGFLLSTAALSLRAPTNPGQVARDALISQIDAAHQEITARSNLVQGYRTEVTSLQNALLESSAPQLVASLRAEEVLAGTSPAAGPGLVLTITDPPVSAEGGDVAARLTDFDLQLVVNSLWASGGEAIAVNGVRLTALSPIRSAGQVIMVDLLPVTSPYRIEVIGNGQELRGALNRSVARHHLEQLSQLYGIDNRSETAEVLQLPAGWRTALSVAEVSNEILGYQRTSVQETGEQ